VSDMTTGPELAIDYAWQHPDPAAIRAAGYSAVLRYVSTDPSKDLTPAEATDLGAAGLGVGLIYETTASRSLGSTVAGQEDGAAMRARLAYLGATPGTLALVNLGDFQVMPAQLGAIRAYYVAFASSLNEYAQGAGGYGTGWLIDQLAPTFGAGIWWQNAMDDQGQLGSVVSDHASIYQRVRPTRALTGAAGEYDEDVYGFGPRPNLAWWHPGGAAPAPLPPSPDWWLKMPVIRQGATGPAVRTVQGLLVARYYRLGTSGQLHDGIDGVFGPLTDAAVREAQGAARIAVDGIVGPQTWPVLAGV
jgi:hypothetical protein